MMFIKFIGANSGLALLVAQLILCPVALSWDERARSGERAGTSEMEPAAIGESEEELVQRFLEDRLSEFESRAGLTFVDESGEPISPIQVVRKIINTEESQIEISARLPKAPELRSDLQLTMSVNREAMIQEAQDGELEEVAKKITPTLTIVAPENPAIQASRQLEMSLDSSQVFENLNQLETTLSSIRGELETKESIFLSAAPVFGKLIPLLAIYDAFFPSVRADDRITGYITISNRGGTGVVWYSLLHFFA